MEERSLRTRTDGRIDGVETDDSGEKTLQKKLLAEKLAIFCVSRRSM